ncbi:hypothetical protein [Clostridium sp.]|uniref:hypothetical protein n=1 Tax=Clostridium sp. TaxID=1506 RepID=UPI0029096AFB|nr:hypothetical protein [Clostridium sp.]MDU5108084.1 hypothetical protein [Clostridium sp.]
MFGDSYEIYSLTFPKELRELIVKKPQLVLIKSDEDINGLKEYFINLLNSLNDTYSFILSETNPLILQNKINTLSHKERIDICIFFKIKCYFNPKMKPSIKSFCNLLNIHGSPNLSGLLKKLINTNELLTPKLTYPIQVKCVNCSSPINTDITYLGSSNYSKSKLYCSNCNHIFLLVISNNERKFKGTTSYSFSNLNTPNCNCNSCKNWLNSFTSYIENNIENFRKELFNYINDKVINTNPTLSLEQLEQLYNVHKKSLTKIENELLNLSFQNIDIIEAIIFYMNNRNQNKPSKNKLFENLVKHGVIYEIIDENLLKTNINKYIDKYTYLLNLISSNKQLKISGETYGITINEITPPYSIRYTTPDMKDEYINLCIINIGSIKKYTLNDYYFNKL